MLDPPDFLAEFRAPSRSDGRHIPPKDSHLIRYYIPDTDWDSQTPLFRRALAGLRGRRHARGDLLRITHGVGCGDGLRASGNLA